MDKEQEKVVELINYLKEWFDEKINTIKGAAESDALKISFTSGDKEFANIAGRDKDMFLPGLKTSTTVLGDFPISMTAPDGHSLITTSDSNRLEFLIENRLRIERWNVAEERQYFVFNEDDEVIAQDFTSREAIDLAIQKYKSAENA